MGGYAEHALEEDTEESKRHRITKTLIQLEKAKQKPVSFSVLTKCGFDGEKYTESDAPLPNSTRDLQGNMRDYLVSFEKKDYLHIMEKYNNDWWIGRVVKEDCEVSFIPSPLKIAHIRRQLKEKKKGHRHSAYSGAQGRSNLGSMNHLDDHDVHQERFNDYDNDYDMKDTGPLNLGKKSNKLGKHEQPYVVVPNMRPLVFVGPSLKGYEITDMMQKSLFDYLKTAFEGRCNIVRIQSDLSQARPNMQKSEETRQVCDDIDRIYELGKSLQLVILDCDMINNPVQLEKSGLMPITVFIKISDPNVLKRLIKTRGRNQIRSMGVQTMAAEKLCQCDPSEFDITLDENLFEEACEHLTDYLEAYWKATHPKMPENAIPKELVAETEARQQMPNVLTKLVPKPQPRFRQPYDDENF